MKKLTILVTLAALTLVGCQKDMTTDAVVNSGITTISIALEESRTALGEKSNGIYPTYWSEGDCIAVNGIKSNEAIINSQNNNKAIFSVAFGYTFSICGKITFLMKFLE